MYIIEKIKDYENYYIDTNGIIYTSYILGGRGKISNTIRPLKYGYNKDGYKRVVLSVNGKKYYKEVHRLMAKQFLYNYNENLVVNHLDGNKENDNINNLEMTTIQGNTKHAWETGLITKVHNEIPITINDGVKTINYLSIASLIKDYPIFSREYLKELKSGTIRYERICLFKNNNIIECYFNGSIIKTFRTNIEAAKYFNKSNNTISYKIHNQRDLKYKIYTLSFL